MNTTFLAKLLSISGLLVLSFAGYLHYSALSPADTCQVEELKMSQLEIDRKDKDRLGLHMDYSYGTKVKKYIRHVKKLESKFYFKKRQKNKPSLISLTTEFKSKKKAKSAFRYLTKKWKKRKKGQYDVVLQGKEVTWFRNSHSTPQCFYKAVASTKKQMGITEETQKKPKLVAKKAKKLKKKRKNKKKLISYKKH